MQGIGGYAVMRALPLSWLITGSCLSHISLPGCRIVSRSDDVKKHRLVISQPAR